MQTRWIHAKQAQQTVVSVAPTAHTTKRCAQHTPRVTHRTSTTVARTRIHAHNCLSKQRRRERERVTQRSRVLICGWRETRVPAHKQTTRRESDGRTQRSEKFETTIHTSSGVREALCSASRDRRRRAVDVLCLFSAVKTGHRSFALHCVARRCSASMTLTTQTSANQRDRSNACVPVTSPQTNVSVLARSSTVSHGNRVQSVRAHSCCCCCCCCYTRPELCVVDVCRR